MTHPATNARLRVLISAYACGPGDEPEAAAGWTMATAAAESHDVWVLTRRRFRSAIENELATRPPTSGSLHVAYIDLPERAMALKTHSWDLYWYYAAWQALAARHGRALHARVDLDVVHHATWANDWLPCGAAEIPGPALVWGPVGGASTMPIRRLARWLGPRGTATELARTAATAIPRRIWGDRAAGRAALVVAQNPDVAARFAFARHVVVEPNAALRDLPQIARPEHTQRDRLRAVFPARLLAWKGGRLAIDAIARSPRWELDIYGAGYERGALERRAARLGVAERVRFHGHRARAEVLSSIATADALLFPSMHDQAGWVAAEADALGCPVVCLPLGGPPVLAGSSAVVASLEGDIVQNVAEALERAALHHTRPAHRWAATRFPALVDSWYRLAVG